MRDTFFGPFEPIHVIQSSKPDNTPISISFLSFFSYQLLQIRPNSKLGKQKFEEIRNPNGTGWPSQGRAGARTHPVRVRRVCFVFTLPTAQAASTQQTTVG
jgi:hypothetical protein